MKNQFEEVFKVIGKEGYTTVWSSTRVEHRYG